MFRTRRMASCCETFAGSICRISLSSLTPFSPSRRQSKIRMRMGCARALKNSAVKLAICCGMLILGYAHTLICEVHYVKCYHRVAAISEVLRTPGKGAWIEGGVFARALSAASGAYFLTDLSFGVAAPVTVWCCSVV